MTMTISSESRTSESVPELASLVGWRRAILCPAWDETMSLVFAMLQKDFVLFAADRRHTRGDHLANYRYDGDTKVHEVMNGSALFGFAGHNLCEHIFCKV